MTKQEQDKIIKELQKKFIKEMQNELKQLIAKAEQPKRWKPKKDEEYWHVGNYGEINSTTYHNDNYDDWSYLTGNCFETYEEAEEYKKQIEYTALYKNYIEEHSEPLDWNNGNQPKYYVCFQQSCAYKSEPLNQIKIYTNYWSKDQGTIYASSEQIIWDAIHEIGEDNFKKYVLEVK